MKINAVRDTLPLHASTSSRREHSSFATPISHPAERAGTDTVKFSQNASFQSKLDVETKKFTSLASTNLSSASVSRLTELKISYKGEHCPTSGADIAGAMMEKILGTDQVSREQGGF